MPRRHGSGLVAVLALALVAVLLVYAELAGATPRDDCPNMPGTQVIIPRDVVIRPVPGSGIQYVRGCKRERRAGGIGTPLYVPAADGYGGTGGTTQATLEGSLPFTGLDVAFVLFAGFIVLVLGLLLLRPVKPKGDDE